jgi:hypothetical protein
MQIACSPKLRERETEPERETQRERQRQKERQRERQRHTETKREREMKERENLSLKKLPVSLYLKNNLYLFIMLLPDIPACTLRTPILCRCWTPTY